MAWMPSVTPQEKQEHILKHFKGMLVIADGLDAISNPPRKTDACGSVLFMI